jgi:hypothetical protein
MDLTKKISLILSVAILMGLIFVVPASFAKNVDNPEIVFTAKEIKDKDNSLSEHKKELQILMHHLDMRAN